MRLCPTEYDRTLSQRIDTDLKAKAGALRTGKPEIPPEKMLHDEIRSSLLAALDWQIELGADEAIGEDFIDRTQTPPPAPIKTPAPAASAPLIPLQGADTAATAAGCPDLQSLKQALADHPHPLKEGARTCVFADGNPTAKVMIIGEAPGRDEDMQGLPFVGKSGQLLDRMLAAIGLDRKVEDAAGAVYIANILPWRPPSNRTPSVEEAGEFRPFTDRHIALINPAIVITMGNVSTKTLLETQTGIMRMRGSWTEAVLGGKNRPVLPMLHPAYLLRQPQDKRHAWADLLSLKLHLESLS